VDRGAVGVAMHEQLRIKPNHPIMDFRLNCIANGLSAIGLCFTRCVPQSLRNLLPLTQRFVQKIAHPGWVSDFLLKGLIVMIEGAKFVTMDDNKLGVGNPVDQANASLSEILSRYQKISIAQNEQGIGSDITAEIKELFVQR